MNTKKQERSGGFSDHSFFCLMVYDNYNYGYNTATICSFFAFFCFHDNYNLGNDLSVFTQIGVIINDLISKFSIDLPVISIVYYINYLIIIYF